MTALTLEKYRSHKRAQAGRSHWIKTQKMWDRILKIKTGSQVYPKPHDVYRVERKGKLYFVVFDDPTM